MINSCTVTATGDQKTRRMLRHLKSQNPDAVVALTGCYPRPSPTPPTVCPADVVTGARPGTAHRARGAGPRHRGGLSTSARTSGSPSSRCAPSSFQRTRAFVKIEDGCERYCAYCIIPTARGPVRSKAGRAARRARGAREGGLPEAVLVGINLSCYGKDLGLRLIDAVELACSVEGIERVRLGSLEPELLTDGDIERMSRQPKLCPQFHLSLQSGCDATLKRMNRHYDAVEYARIAGSLRRHFDNCAVTTDIMVGFPGEDEAEFAQSLAFAEEIALAKAHVFAYSAGPAPAPRTCPVRCPAPSRRPARPG
ncbi:MAG: radical SAM protein [Anaerotruncus massiliensis (ex Togo et al. 2019)]